MPVKGREGTGWGMGVGVGGAWAYEVLVEWSHFKSRGLGVEGAALLSILSLGSGRPFVFSSRVTLWTPTAHIFYLIIGGIIRMSRKILSGMYSSNKLLSAKALRAPGCGDGSSGGCRAPQLLGG